MCALFMKTHHPWLAQLPAEKEGVVWGGSVNTMHGSPVWDRPVLTTVPSGMDYRCAVTSLCGRKAFSLINVQCVIACVCVCVCTRMCEPDTDLVCASVFCMWIYVTGYMWFNCLSLHTQWFKSRLVPGHHIIAFCVPSPSHIFFFPESRLCCGNCISLHLFKYGLVCLTLPHWTSSLPPLFPSVCFSWLFYCLAFQTLFPSFPFFATPAKKLHVE